MNDSPRSWGSKASDSDPCCRRESGELSIYDTPSLGDTHECDLGIGDAPEAGLQITFLRGRRWTLHSTQVCTAPKSLEMALKVKHSKDEKEEKKMKTKVALWGAGVQDA